LAQPLLKPITTRRQKVVNRVSSLIEVARRFGGGALHLSSGGSFGGTELPVTVRGHKGEAADEAPCQRLGGASAGLISSH